MREAKRHIAGFLVLALFLAGLAAYITYKYVALTEADCQARIQQLEAAQGAQVEVLVAAREIPAQVPLTRADLETVSIPNAFVQPGMETDKDKVVGKVSLVPLPKGALVLSHAVADRVVIPEGKRVIRLYRSQVVQFDQNLMVGDAVDLVVTQRDAKTNAVETKLLMSKLPVVEVDPNAEWIGIEVPEKDVATVVELEITAVQMHLLRVTPDKEVAGS